MPPVTGIYGLYIGTGLVYIGKAADKSDLRRRLWSDARKISASKNIKLVQMQCRFLLISKEWVHYAEYHLLKNYQPAWNISGFGRYVPGAGRPAVKGPPTRNKRPQHK